MCTFGALECKVDAGYQYVISSIFLQAFNGSHLHHLWLIVYFEIMRPSLSESIWSWRIQARNLNAVTKPKVLKMQLRSLAKLLWFIHFSVWLTKYVVRSLSVLRVNHKLFLPDMFEVFPFCFSSFWCRYFFFFLDEPFGIAGVVPSFVGWQLVEFSHLKCVCFFHEIWHVWPNSQKHYSRGKHQQGSFKVRMQFTLYVGSV